MKSKTQSILIALGTLTLVTTLSNCVDPNSGYSTSVTYQTGSQIQRLPQGYRTEIVGNTTYYVHNGHYFRSQSGRYVVVEAPRHDYQHDSHVSRLPSGYRIVRHHGVPYYRVGDTYYSRSGSGYVVVARPF